MAWLNRFRRHMAAAALSLAVAACGQDAQAPTAANAPGADNAANEARPVWRHGIVEAKGDSGILFMPARGGFGDKYGLTLEMTQFVASTTPVRALIAGQLDSFETSPVVVMPAIQQGADLKVVGCHWPVMNYDLYSKVDAIAQLKGQTVGVSTPGSLPDVFVREVLAISGLKDNDVKYANAGGSTDRFKSVAAGVIAAAPGSSEFEIEAPKYGVKVLVHGAEATPKLLRSCIWTTSKIINERRADLEKFLAASMDGYAHALSHRDEMIKLSRATAGLPPEDTSAEFVFEEVRKYNAVTPDLAIDLDKLEWTMNVMVRHGAITEAIDVAGLIDEAPRQAALKLAGAN